MADPKNTERADEGGKVVSMHPDAKIAPRIDRILGILSTWQASVTTPFVAQVFQSIMDLLHAARFMGNDELLERTSFLVAEVCIDLDEYFSKMDVPAPANKSELTQLPELTRAHFAQQRFDLQEIFVLTKKKLETLTASYEALRLEDRKNINRVGTTLGGSIAHLTKAASEERLSLQLLEQIEELQAEVREVRAELTATKKTAVKERSVQIESLIDKLDRAVLRLDLAPSEPAASSGTDRPATFDLQALTVELGRRTTWLESYVEAQLHLEEQRSDLDDRLQEMEDAVRFSADDADGKSLRSEKLKLTQERVFLSLKITRLVELQSAERRNIDALNRIREAHSLIASGIPAELAESFGKALPALAEVVEMHPPAPQAATAQDDHKKQLAIQTAATNRTVVGRRASLDAIAASVRMTPSYLLFVTLFEILPRFAEKEYPYRKSAGSIAAAARQAGILSAFGWDNYHLFNKELLGNPQPDEVITREAYLSFKGSPGGNILFVRTSQKIGWEPEAILTSDETLAFRKHIREREKPR